MTRPVDVPFSIHDRVVFFPDTETLVLADIHFGHGDNVDAPIGGGTDVIDRLETVVDETNPQTVVVAGDLLHAFSRLPRGVEDDLSALVAAVDRAGASLVVTPGNHDTMLPSVFDGDLPATYRVGRTVVCHGHDPPDEPADRYVIGHDHPAISIDGHKRPCLLYGPNAYAGADVLVLPAFTRLARGSTVNRMATEAFQSPLITDIDAFHPVVWDDGCEEALWFPPLGECRQLL